MAIVGKLLAAGALGALCTVSAMEAAAASYTWKHRPLYVFAAPGDPALQAQRRIVADNLAAMRERDIVIVWVAGDAVKAELGPGPGESASALRRRFGVGSAEFKAVLVGKDGGAKMSQGSPVSAARLFATIDAMPMRRDELRRRG